jgi:hypothetical protein
MHLLRLLKVLNVQEFPESRETTPCQERDSCEEVHYTCTAQPATLVFVKRGALYMNIEVIAPKEKKQLQGLHCTYLDLISSLYSGFSSEYIRYSMHRMRYIVFSSGGNINCAT